MYTATEFPGSYIEIFCFKIDPTCVIIASTKYLFVLNYIKYKFNINLKYL